jgi:hypothetical protein
MAQFADGLAGQNERDHRAMLAAIRTRRIELFEEVRLLAPAQRCRVPGND